jgi:outer membrane immunogenic protein
MTKTAFAALALGVGVLFSANMAHAADPIAPAFDWSGPYMGIQAGYGWGDSDHTDVGGNGTGDFDIDGFVGGGTVGFNHQMDNLVLGVEMDLSLAGINGNSDTFGGAYETHIDWFGTTRLRAGFAVDNILLFATGGLAFGEVEGSTINFGGVSNSDVNFGWTVGAGAEFAFSEQLSFKAEYLYVDLGEVRLATGTPLDATADNNHIARIGLNWHF